MDLEERQKKLTAIIRSKKDQGYQGEDRILEVNDRGAKDIHLRQQENTAVRLELVVQELEEQKAKIEYDAKTEQRDIADQIKKIGNEVLKLEMQLKEKEQELKLNDLKCKELRKQLPNNKLKPLNRNDYRKAKGLQDNRSMDHNSHIYLTSLPNETEISIHEE